MANPDRAIDNTHLSIDQATRRGFVHRDYIAHCLRWSCVVNELSKRQRYKSAHVLDVGCGVDLPLAKLMYSSRFIPQNYIGVDWNYADRFDMGAFKQGGAFPMNAYGRVDFASNQVLIGEEWVGDEPPADRPDHAFIEIGGDQFAIPNLITCFEVLEHVTPSHARAMLKKMHAILSLAENSPHRPLAFISTPNWDPNVGAAQNHINEMKHDALNSMIEDLGFEIMKQVGTFASMRDYLPKFYAEFEGARDIFEALQGCYDVNYLATIFAPLYPAEARNCMRVIAPAGSDYERKYPPLAKVEGPWSQSDFWETMASVKHYNSDLED